MFIQTEPKIIIKPNTKIRLKDVASVYSTDEDFRTRVEQIEIGETGDNDKNQVISLISLITKIKTLDSEANIRVYGVSEILVDIRDDKHELSIVKFLKLSIVSLLLFIGAGIAIINFHDDVNMEDSLETINYIITGSRVEGFLYLKIAYSLGLGVGMVTFFNRVLKKKTKSEPSPLELEMYTYKKNIDNYILEQTKHNKK